MKRIITSSLTLAAATLAVQGTVYLNDNFSTYSAGNLVGQNSWSQYSTVSTLPLTISGGKVVIPGGQTADAQDGLHTFTTVTAPSAGTTSLFCGMRLTVSSASAGTVYYFGALYDGNYIDDRLVAKDNGAGAFTYGARVNGQSGYPFVYGTSALSYNVEHLLVIQADMVAGNANDVLKLYVDPTSSDLSTQTPYLTATYSSGTVADPAQYTGVLLSQYSTASYPNTGLSLSRLTVADSFSELMQAIPEPGSMSLLSLGLAGLLFRRGRRS